MLLKGLPKEIWNIIITQALHKEYRWKMYGGFEVSRLLRLRSVCKVFQSAIMLISATRFGYCSGTFKMYTEFRKNVSLAHSIVIEIEKQIGKLRAQAKILDNITGEIRTKLTVLETVKDFDQSEIQKRTEKLRMDLDIYTSGMNNTRQNLVNLQKRANHIQLNYFYHQSNLQLFCDNFKNDPIITEEIKQLSTRTELVN